MPTLSLNEQHATDTWTLFLPDGTSRDMTHVPIIGCSDFGIIEQAAIDGVGIALLPHHIVERGFRTGALVPVLPEWTSKEVIVHLVFTSRHGILPGFAPSSTTSRRPCPAPWRVAPRLSRAKRHCCALPNRL